MADLSKKSAFDWTLGYKGGDSSVYSPQTSSSYQYSDSRQYVDSRSNSNVYAPIYTINSPSATVGNNPVSRADATPNVANQPNQWASQPQQSKPDVGNSSQNPLGWLATIGIVGLGGLILVKYL